MEPIPDPEPVQRVAARVLLIDPAGRLLLFRGHDPQVPGLSFWFTVGGGLDPGEELVACALRELREETGMQVAPELLVGPVWVRRVRFRFEGVGYASEEWFFLAGLTEAAAAIDTAGFTELEIRTVLDHRWWSAGELRASTETIYPPQLPELLCDLLAAGWDGRLHSLTR